ncbi:MAG: hypothetical protein H6734_21890 [Alphaproteobacteria bacterium]|nr:hypothetical protein [Alphaproteobacteria bacterium]
MPSVPSLPEDLLAVLCDLDRPAELARVLGDLLTPSEVEALAERWTIVKLLAGGHPQRAVRDEVGCSVTTVSRGARQLRYGEGGFDLAFDRLAALGLGDPRA